MEKYQELHSTTSDALNEPVSTYGSVDYASLASRMVTKTYVKHVMRISRLSVTDLIEVIPISIDTYKRKTEFNPPVTEKILEIQEVYERGLDAFGEDFYRWIDTPNVALGGKVPKSLLSNSFGIRRLLDQIGRMEHGILA